MNQKQAEKNLKVFYLFEAFREPLFWGAILITYIQKVSGMSLADIFFMESVCVFVVIFLEIPTGALADIIGRKKAIIAGQILELACLILFALAARPLDIWLANILCFAGIALVHGADTSLLYDTLKFLQRDGQEFKKIKGQATSILLFLAALCNLSSGYLAEINLRLPIYLAAGFFVIDLIASMLFTEPPIIANKQLTAKGHWNLMKTSIFFVANNQKIKWLTAFTLLIGTASKIWFFTYNPYFQLVNLPLRYYGWFFCCFGIISALSSYYAGSIYKKIGDLASVLLIISLISMPIVAMGSFVTIWILGMILVQNLVRGYFPPFAEHLTHECLDSKNRATVFSIISTMRGLSDALFLFLFSLLLTRVSLPQSLQILGMAAILIGLAIIAAYKKIFVSAKN